MVAGIKRRNGFDRMVVRCIDNDLDALAKGVREGQVEQFDNSKRVDGIVFDVAVYHSVNVRFCGRLAFSA